MKICTRCVMDITDPNIYFDSEGVCNHCKEAEVEVLKIHDNISNNLIDKLIIDIKLKGKGKKYDCIIGVSGGVDSTYVALKVKEYGLRPLAVHFDNGWNSELAVKNIEKTLKKLGIPLVTKVVNWNEFKDLQLAFLKASVPDCEIPSDHAIVSLLYKEAHKNNVKYIIGGTNSATESIMPNAWSQGHSDWKYIKNVQKQFGTKDLKTFPRRTYLNIIIDKHIKKIKWVSLLDYIEYDKEKALKEIENRLGYVRYKHKHSESNYTKFYQGYILPQKFGYDKRKAHLSSLIVSNQIDRQDALVMLNEPIYEQKELNEDKNFVISKFDIEEEEFNKILANQPNTYYDFRTYNNDFFWSNARKFYLKLKRNIRKEKS